MDIERIREQIYKEENEFPKSFTFYEERDYGILFYNPDNQESGDSNHSVIYPEKIKDLCWALRDIANFYNERIYPPTRIFITLLPRIILLTTPKY